MFRFELRTNINLILYTKVSYYELSYLATCYLYRHASRAATRIRKYISYIYNEIFFCLDEAQIYIGEKVYRLNVLNIFIFKELIFFQGR